MIASDIGTYARMRPVVPGARFFSKCCTRCNETKPLDQFWRRAGGALGRQAACIACTNSGARRGVDPRTAQYETDATLALVREKFALNVDGAVVYREDSRGGHRKAGEVAGALRRDGYREIKVTLAPSLKRLYRAHRIAFALANGRWPGPHEQVDHVDHAKSSTDPARLREVSGQVNKHNQHAPSAANTSGVRGVSWDRQARKWAAQIKVDGKARRIGCFDDKVDAGIAYAAAKRRYQHAVPLETVARIVLSAASRDHDHLSRINAIGAAAIVLRDRRLAADLC